MDTFTIKTVHARTTNIDAYPWVVEVVVSMPAKEWTKARDKGWLGSLYGISISNAVYKLNRAIPAHNPTVDDRDRAKAGLKTIRLSYYLSDADKAEQLGLQVKRLKNGTILPGFGDVAFIYDSRKAA